MKKTIHTRTKLGNISLSNHIVMAPMTRCRAINNIPNKLMADYYSQRASIGLLITEGIAPSANGIGYARIPGLYTQEQISGWKNVVDNVHKSGGKIFAQLMHTGRISHSENMPEGSTILAPSAVAAKGKMHTDSKGMQIQPIPKEMNKEEINQTQNEFINAAQNAISAGFDGIELHAANGYLLDQFLHPNSNFRTDEYGGSIENRSRFVLEVVHKVTKAIGKDKTGIRLSPYGAFNDLSPFEETDEEYSYLTKELNKTGLVYIHLVDHSSMGTPQVPLSLKKKIRENYQGTLILSGGYDAQKAEFDLNTGLADLIAFGRPALSNPDLITRLKENIKLNEVDMDTFYTPGEKGYTDYPLIGSATVV